MKMDLPILTKDTINQNLRDMEMPWPSVIVSRAYEIEQDIKMGKPHPFKEVLHVHEGDPQGHGQKPITFFRQTASLCLNPSLLQSMDFPTDVKERATTITRNCKGQIVGCYTDAEGMVDIRKQVAKFIEERDGVPAKYEDIFISTGATDAIRVIIYLFINKDSVQPPGVMIPIPQYPLFSSTIVEYGMHQVKYYLNEETQWSLDVSELRRAFKESRAYCKPKVLVIVNPGNPSGSVLSKEEIENIIKFAYEENLFIMADEVYQQNVYDPEIKFHSFKKIMFEMGAPYDKMELASFMSGSKGYMGECGARSGYCEIVNMDGAVKEILYKLLTKRASVNLLGQIIMYCITNPPHPEEPSYKLFETEKNLILNSLKERALFCYEKLNSVRGLSCNKVMGAIFVYPRIHLSKKALKEAEARNQTPDECYAMEMLQKSGVCVLPGSHFGQRPGTYHFRITFLSQMKRLKEVMEKILSFHQHFMEEYKD